MLNFMHNPNLSMQFEKRGQLLHSEQIGILQPELISILLTNAEIKPNTRPKEIAIFKISYSTVDTKGRLSVASAQVAFPIHTAPLRVLCYHHGSITLKTEVPSSMRYDSGQLHAGFFAGIGHFFVVQPDYLGLGDSPEVIHPYLQIDTLASASIDAMIAARAFAVQHKIEIEQDIYLAGYSEGGLATLATLHALENSDRGKLNVLAAAPGAGPYLFKKCLLYTLQHPGPGACMFAAYFLYARHKLYQDWPKLEDVFQTPYDHTIPILFDGTQSIEFIIDNLPAIPQELLQPSFFKALVAFEEPVLNTVLAQMDFTSWLPKTPLAFIGAKADEDVPFFNSIELHQHWVKQGVHVSLINIGDELGHRTGKPKTLEAQLNFLNINLASI